MREIRFRGKRIDNGEWVHGYIVKVASPCGLGWVMHIPAKDPDDNHRVVQVNPSTVGQYTGLKDKGGVEIYEGDICKYWMDRVWKIGYIVWHQGGFALRVFKMGERDTDEIFPFQHFIPVPRTGNVMQDQFEIIGTTHDNPELLGGAE